MLSPFGAYLYVTKNNPGFYTCFANIGKDGACNVAINQSDTALQVTSSSEMLLSGCPVGMLILGFWGRVDACGLGRPGHWIWLQSILGKACKRGLLFVFL